MVGIAESGEKGRGRRYSPHSVTFSDNEEIINPGTFISIRGLMGGKGFTIFSRDYIPVYILSTIVLHDMYVCV